MVSQATLALPGVPRGLRALVNSGGVPVRYTASYQWHRVPGATDYELYITTSTTAPTAETTATFTSRNVHYTTAGSRFRSRTATYEADTQYYVYVRARNAVGRSDWSVPVTFTPAATPALTAPQDVHVVPQAIFSYDRTYERVYLGWNYVQGARYFDFYVTTSATAPTASTEPTQLGLGPSRGVTSDYVRDLFQNTTYRAYVRARDATRTGPWSSSVTFTTTAAPSTLTLPPVPLNFVSSAHTATSITYGWTASAGAFGYDIYISNSNIAPAADTVPTAAIAGGDTVTYTASGLSQNTTYYAYLRAKNTLGATAWTQGVVVTTPVQRAAVPSGFSASASADTTRAQIVYTWTAAAGATGYDIYYSTSSTAPAAGAAATASVGAVTTYTARVNPGTTYYSYLRAKNAGGNSAWTAVLTTAVPALLPAVPTEFGLGTVRFGRSSRAYTHNSISYIWGIPLDNYVSVVGFDFYVSSSATAPTAQTTPTAQIAADGQYFRDYTATGLSSNTQYYGYVRARTARGASAWSAAVTATTDTIVTVPQNFATTGNTSNSISFSWTTQAGAQGYDIFVTSTGARPPQSFGDAVTLSVGAVTTATVSGLLASTAYQCYIRARSRLAATNWTAALSVTTGVAPPGVPAFSSAGQSSSNIFYQWSAIPGATGYDIYVTTLLSAPEADTTPTAMLGAVTSYNATGLTSDTTYRAYIRAKGAGGNSAWSAARVVKTFVAAPPVPTNFAGSSSATDTITFTWTAAARARSYGIYLTTSATPPDSRTVFTHSGITGTSYTATGLTSDTTYRAYIKASNAGGSSAWSAVATVRTLVEAPAQPVVPTRTSGTATSATLGWTATPRATNYDLYISSPLAPPPYSGTTPTATVGNVTTYTRTGLTANTRYLVYLRARNSTGASDWSGGRLFATAPASPLAAPVVTVIGRHQSAVFFSWPAIAGAADYQYYRSTSSTNPTAQTTPTSRTLGDTLGATYSLSSGTTYYLWVRAVSRDGSAGAWSTRVSATTGSAANPPPTNAASLRAYARDMDGTRINYQVRSRGGSAEVYFSTSSARPAQSVSGTRITGSRLGQTLRRTGVSASDTYYGWVRESGGYWDSPPTIWYGTPTAAPFGFTDRAVGQDRITFEWYTVTGAGAYDLYVTTSTSAPEADTVATAAIPHVGFPGTYTLTGLLPNTAYRAYLRAWNSAGKGPWTVATLVTTARAPTYDSTLAVPANFSARGNSGRGQVTVTWDAVSGAAGYDIWVSSPDGSSTPPATSATPSLRLGAVTSHTFSPQGSSPGSFETYYIYVRTRTSTGFSPWSAAAEFSI